MENRYAKTGVIFVLAFIVYFASRRITVHQKAYTQVRVTPFVAGGSPGFPRRHGDPTDYLRRTLARALRELHRAPFP